MNRERIDKVLVDRGLVDSRTRAQALVMAGLVLVIKAHGLGLQVAVEHLAQVVDDFLADPLLDVGLG